MEPTKNYYRKRKKQELFMKIFDSDEESSSRDVLFCTSDSKEFGKQDSDLPPLHGIQPVPTGSPESQLAPLHSNESQSAPVDDGGSQSVHTNNLYNSSMASEASENNEGASSSDSTLSHNESFNSSEGIFQDVPEQRQEGMESILQREGMQESSINHSLIGWYNKHNIPLNALKDLLVILKPYHSSLPADSRTLLQTKSYELEANGTGHLVYFGIKENLKKHINFDLDNIDVLKMDVNIDGVPVFKSRNTSFWPILCSFSNSVKYSKNSVLPFIAAIYYGENKPEINHYLKKFCLEVQSLLQDGITLLNRHYRVEFRSIIADAPAKAYLKQIKTHGGYFACDRCCVKGLYKHKAMSYDDLKADLRSDQSFRDKQQVDHHIGVSPLEVLNIDMVKCFVIDYMHLINLGIVRKLINIYLHKIPYKISANQKEIVNERIKIIRTFFHVILIGSLDILMR